MIFTIPSNRIPFTLVIAIESKGDVKLKITASDDKKPMTFFYNRNIVVNGQREIQLKMPISPKILIVEIYNVEVGRYDNDEDGSFRIVKFEPKKLKQNPVWLKPEDTSFMRFAKQFSENASILSAGDKKPSIYRSDDAKYTIDYYDKIRDKKTGKVVSTPARIGHTTGIIEVSKHDFMQYTVPMRMVILLHEYAHKYKNPKIGKQISDEVAADINALSMYLSEGFSEVEAHRAFLTVFKGSDNAQNTRRYLILKDFIAKFNNGEMNNFITDYKTK